MLHNKGHCTVTVMVLSAICKVSAMLQVILYARVLTLSLPTDQRRWNYLREPSERRHQLSHGLIDNCLLVALPLLIGMLSVDTMLTGSTMNSGGISHCLVFVAVSTQPSSACHPASQPPCQSGSSAAIIKHSWQMAHQKLSFYLRVSTCVVAVGICIEARTHDLCYVYCDFDRAL